MVDQGGSSEGKGGEGDAQGPGLGNGVGIADSEAPREERTFGLGHAELGALKGYPEEALCLRVRTDSSRTGALSVPRGRALASWARGLCPPSFLPSELLPAPRGDFRLSVSPQSHTPLPSLSRHLIVVLCMMDQFYSFCFRGDSLANVSPSPLAREPHRGRDHVFLVPF